MTFYLICHDAQGHYLRDVMNQGWNIGVRADAFEFQARAAAAFIFQSQGKHREGWRVIKERTNG